MEIICEEVGIIKEVPAAEKQQTIRGAEDVVVQPRFSIRGISREPKVQDAETKEEDTEFHNHIAQHIGEHQGSLANAGSKIERKRKEGPDVLQESSSCDEDMVEVMQESSSCDLHRQAGEQFRNNRSLQHHQKRSIGSAAIYLLIKDEESVSPTRNNLLTMSQQQSNLVSEEAISSSDLPVKLPHWVGAARRGDIGQKKGSDSFANRKWLCHLKPMNSEEISMNDSRVHEMISEHLQLGNSCHQEDEDHVRGKFCEFSVNNSSPNPSTFSTSIHFPAADNPIPQDDSALKIHNSVAQTSRPSIQSAEIPGSEYDNVGAEITTHSAANHKIPHILEQINSLNEAPGLEKCKEEDNSLTLGADPSQESTDKNIQFCGALDLLVSAIQVTSGGVFAWEDDASGPSDMIEAGKDVHFVSKEVYFAYGSCPILRKRVIRRAKSAFKDQILGTSLQKLRRFEILEVVPQVLGRENREIHADGKLGVQDKKVNSNLPVAEMAQVKVGGPVIRSMRGRSQVLPTRFSDSVLQPWKRKSRRGSVVDSRVYKTSKKARIL